MKTAAAAALKGLDMDDGVRDEGDESGPAAGQEPSEQGGKAAAKK